MFITWNWDKKSFNQMINKNKISLIYVGLVVPEVGNEGGIGQATSGYPRNQESEGNLYKPSQ